MNRKPIYIRKPLAEILQHREADLSTVVNQVADRYLKLVHVERESDPQAFSFTDAQWQMLRMVAGNVCGWRFNMNDIIGFPSMVRITLASMYKDGHEFFDQSQQLSNRLDGMSLGRLISLIDRLETQ